MTSAYAGILNGGSAVEPYGLLDLRLKGETASLIDQTGGMGERVRSPEEARAQTACLDMKQVVDVGNRQAGRGLPDSAGGGSKTGSSNASPRAMRGFWGFNGEFTSPGSGWATTNQQRR